MHPDLNTANGDKISFNLRELIFTDICRLPLSVRQFFCFVCFSTEQVESRSGSMTVTYESSYHNLNNRILSAGVVPQIPAATETSGPTTSCSSTARMARKGLLLFSTPKKLSNASKIPPIVGFLIWSPQIANPQILWLIPQSQNLKFLRYASPQIANPQSVTFAEGPQI